MKLSSLVCSGNFILINSFDTNAILVSFETIASGGTGKDIVRRTSKAEVIVKILRLIRPLTMLKLTFHLDDQSFFLHIG